VGATTNPRSVPYFNDTNINRTNGLWIKGVVVATLLGKTIEEYVYELVASIMASRAKAWVKICHPTILRVYG
jgi:hypothetical protein